MADTYTLIEKITVGAAGASDVTFTSIPQTYTDLVIKASVRGSNSLDYQYADMIFNNNTSSYSNRFLEGTGASAVSYTTATTSVQFAIGDGNTATTSTFGNAEVYIPNYTGSTNKSVSIDMVSENNATTARTILGAGLWSNTAAITSIKLTATGGTSFLQYSTFYLYGIAKEGVTPSLPSAPYATGGDSIVFDGTYWIHTFLSSGTFTPKKSLTCDYLVVAGGGAGGGARGGGGGAGGYRTSTGTSGGGGSAESALSFTSNVGYTITVGAGGARSAVASTKGDNGSSSSISGTGITTVTSSGGGAAGIDASGSRNGSTGGSGGGGGSNPGGTGGTAGSGTTNQGYAGGAARSTSDWNAGAGGGAGAAGQAGQSANGGAGGSGVASSITGSSVTRAGGGGGGTYIGTGGTATGGGGAGGSSNGTTNNNGSNGTDNTGGGGGGAGGGTGLGGNGGSGIVIVRYAA